MIEPPRYCGEFHAPIPPAPVFAETADRWLKTCHPRGEMPTLESRVVEGIAWERILRADDDCRCDLIVMGSEGKTGIGRALLGSEAEQVARQAPCPVPICKQPVGTATAAAAGAGRPLFSTILFPVDLSDRARGAFAVASAMASRSRRSAGRPKIRNAT